MRSTRTAIVSRGLSGDVWESDFAMNRPILVRRRKTIDIVEAAEVQLDFIALGLKHADVSQARGFSLDIKSRALPTDGKIDTNTKR